jgi:hypothetical protein
MTPNFEEILLELSYRIPQGIVDLSNEQHLNELISILEENRVPNAKQLALEAKKSLEKVLATTFKNPETGNLVKVDSALRYKKSSQAFKIASNMLDKSGYSEDDLETVDAGPDDEEKPNVFGKGKGASVFPAKSKPEPKVKPTAISTTSDLNLKPEEVSKRTAALAHVIQKDFTPELKKSLGDKGIKTLVGGFEKMISNQKVSTQEKDLLQKFVAFKDKEGEATLYIANVTPGEFKKHKKVEFGATKREALKQLTQSFGLQSTKAQEGALGKKEVVANKVTKARKVITAQTGKDGSVVLEGVTHKPIAIPKEKELALELNKLGIPNAQIEAKTAIAALKRYNKQLEMMSTAGKFEAVDFGDTSTPEGRAKTFDNVKKLYTSKFSELFQRNGAVTKEQKVILDKFNSIKFNQNGSNPKFEEQIDDVLSSMTMNKDFRTAVPDLLEVLVFSKMLGRGYHAFLPSSETFKVSDVIAFKEPNLKLPKDGNIAKSIADNFKMIKTSMVLVGGQSVKFAEGGAGQSDSKVEQTEYKHPETKVVLQNLLTTHQFVYGKSKDGKYPPSTQDVAKREKQIMFHLDWALKNNVISNEEYKSILATADKQAENAFQTALRNGVGPLSKTEQMEYKKLLRLHTLSGASVQTINNNDTDFNYFSNERSKVNERTGVVVNEELDGIIKKCCMGWSYNPGFKFGSFGGKKWMTPNNVNPSHIVSCDKKKR